MASFRTMTDRALPSQITLFTGNEFTFKILPGANETVPFTMNVSSPNTVAIVRNEVRQAANFQIIGIRVNTAGSAILGARNSRGVTAGPINITINRPLILPNGTPDSMALMRLLLAEAPSPYSRSYNAATALQGMQWMRRVVDNRLRRRSSDVGSGGANSYIDVIRSRGQFEGFGSYPVIGTRQAENIANMLALANDGSHPRQALFYNHVNFAIAAATGRLIADPCPTGLFGWRTAGASSPGGRFVKFRTFSGQDFYTIG
jgi:hypothetical protein